MKLNRLETHDRLEHLKKDQSASLVKGCEDCLKKNSLSLAYQERSPYIYIYAHPRTHDDGVTKVMYWEPRLSKPNAETNSYLFRARSKTDQIEIMWMIPAQEQWNQYTKGNVTESGIVRWSIAQYRTNKLELEKPDKDDLPDEKCKQILLDIAREMDQDRQMRKLYTKKDDECLINP